ncbi:MAG: transaldolase [candidate division KSB1 bacterium]|nr:transaldolase [candidate division KSB1 bacterium]
MSILDQLKQYTTIVADTGEIESIRKFMPQDATTNPSLLLKAVQKPEYKQLVAETIKSCDADPDSGIKPCLEWLMVRFAEEILSIIPGRVSVEIDASLSFDTENTIKAAERLLEQFNKRGVDTDRLLFKIASTWEGIRAAEQLEKQGVHCNLTLLFSYVQAAACADAGVTLISPFVGRILDWYKADRGVDHIPPEEDPGVQSVADIYNYFKKSGIQTEIMGASFRNSGQIRELAGCDLLTISPDLLKELSETEGSLERKLSPESARQSDVTPLHPDEKAFRWLLNENAMATEKLSEGIRKFNADWVKLADLILEQYR